MTRPDVPTLEAVELLPGRLALVTVEGGQVFTLSPDTTPRAVFMSETAYGPVLNLDWKDPAAPAYYVPASLVDVLARYYLPPTVQGFQQDGPALTLICDHAGHEYRHTISTPAPCNTYNLEELIHPSGRPFFTVNPDGPGRTSFLISPHAWPYLAFMLSGKGRKPVSTKRPLPTVAGVEVLPGGTALFTLDTGETVTLKREHDAACSGPNHAPYILWLERQQRYACLVPDALICAAVEAFKQKGPGQS